jgi:hypothetical protein
VDFVVENSNKLQKLGLEGKVNSILNVFTLGPMAHVTLINENDVNKIKSLRPKNIARIHLALKYFQGFNNDFITEDKQFIFNVKHKYLIHITLKKIYIHDKKNPKNINHFFLKSSF